MENWHILAKLSQWQLSSESDYLDWEIIEVFSYEFNKFITAIEIKLNDYLNCVMGL